ncbi:hypothetical protein [Breznakiella homolactica]|uniref:Uncharacterized protein n=1 Tax=Breznakiella homolactica TaxID=2798577 RepID=A0A7T7XPI3_9SPIR|nr:hypothetical protein [Breznakiella homolactica]QQO10003.1 hypothetical protein JFL75_03560 [Breznakiella homolactica]
MVIIAVGVLIMSVVVFVQMYFVGGFKLKYTLLFMAAMDAVFIIAGSIFLMMQK